MDVNQEPGVFDPQNVEIIATKTDRPILIIVSGPPAAGKTTIASEIGRRLGLPVFTKDTLKESLHDSFKWSDLESSRKFGFASTMLLYRMLDVQLSSGQSVIAEMNFYAEFDSPRILEMASRFSCQLFQVHCTAQPGILVARYVARARSGDRHPAHVDSERTDELITKLAEDVWAPLDLCAPLAEIDTSDIKTVSLDKVVGNLENMLPQ